MPQLLQRMVRGKPQGEIKGEPAKRAEDIRFGAYPVPTAGEREGLAGPAASYPSATRFAMWSIASCT